MFYSSPLNVPHLKFSWHTLENGLNRTATVKNSFLNCTNFVTVKWLKCHCPFTQTEPVNSEKQNFLSNFTNQELEVDRSMLRRITTMQFFLNRRVPRLFHKHALRLVGDRCKHSWPTLRCFLFFFFFFVLSRRKIYCNVGFVLITHANANLENAYFYINLLKLSPGWKADDVFRPQIKVCLSQGLQENNDTG